MPVLKCFAAMCYNNENVCQAVAQFTFNGTSVPDLINRLQSRSNTSEMQMAAAKCLTFLHRGNAIQADSPIIRLETLPTLVRMCKKDRTLEENVEGAETLAYLIQQDKDLQMIASICDHSMRALAEYLSYTEIQQVDLSNQTPRKKVDWGSLLKQAAFKAFAAIGANDEKIREKIIAIDGLMDSVVMGMNSEDPNVQVAACRCLHSLSRSVQTIRTTFQDHAVWKPLVKLTQSDSTEVTKMASSTLCNLLLVFSPCKEALLNTGAIQIIVAMTKHKDYDIRLNGVWSLMNLTYCLDLERKKDVLTELGDKHLAALLAETDYHIQCRMMGFLANLINMKADKEPESSHRDAVLSTQIGKIMQQGVKSILCNDTLSGKVKDLALAVLSSMVENVELKTAMLQDDMFLRRVADYLDVKELTLSTVAVFRSLIGCDQDLQKSERIQVLKDKGIWHRLQRHIQK